MQITEFADRFIAALELGAAALEKMAGAQILQATAYAHQTQPSTTTAAAPQQDAPKAEKPKGKKADKPVEKPPVEQAAPEISAEELKKAAQLYAARRKVAGSANPAADVGVLIQAHANVSKTADVPAELRADCLAALEADWLPAEDEL